jgi:hypothetical protein
MAITVKSAKMLWGRAAGLCSMPACRKPLVLDETDADSEALIGDMCHIVAASDDGPRGLSSLTKEERDHYSNLILLCPDHHSEIDGQPGIWPVERLRAIKSEHERWVRNRPGYDRNRQNDEETYAGYVEDWARKCDLDNWRGWGSFVLGAGRPGMTVAKDQELEQLRRWLLTRIGPADTSHSKRHSRISGECFKTSRILFARMQRNQRQTRSGYSRLNSMTSVSTMKSGTTGSSSNTSSMLISCRTSFWS